MTRFQFLTRAIGAAGLAIVATASLGLGGPAAQASAATTSARSHSASAAACAAGATCMTIPANCPAGTTCPTVTVEPTTDLGTNQWVYLDFANFPPNTIAYVYFCENASPITDTSPPYCVTEGTPQFTYPSQQIPISAQGTGEMSFQTVDDPNANGDTALVGKIPGEATLPGKDFFCGDAADPCSIDVDDWALLPNPPPANLAIPVPEDTAVVPLGFAPPSNGCTKALQVSTYSDFSIEWLLPHEAPVACASKDAAIAVNTATSTSLILPFLQGSNNVVFLDDPQSSDVQAALASNHYSVVPIVASAVVMGYNAAMRGSLGMAPFNDFRLTPDEVAGLVTYAYQGPYNADMVKCGGGQCSAMEELNSVPTYVSSEQYGVYIPSEASGVTETLTNWVCNAKNLPFIAGGQVIHDPNTAQKTMTTSINQKPWPITKCTAFDEFPPLKPLGTLFDLYADPEHQVAKGLRSFSPPAQFQGSPVAGFAPVDWGDARYYGLDAASLQNADGQFEAPSAASVQAEISALPLSKSGYPVPDPTLSVPGGYPMSTVIDALVPDEPLPTAQAKSIAAMMNNLLDYTTSAQLLPDGYVPLPAKLASLAHTELARTLAAEDGKIITTTVPTASPAATTTGGKVTYSAAVSATSGAPTGTVKFTIGSSSLCSATLSGGTASCSASNAPTGIDTVTAAYAGAGDFARSSGTTTLQVSTPGSTTGTTAPGGVTGSTVPATSVPSTVPTTLPSKTRTKSPKPGGEISIADVTLSAATARLVLPVALIVGGSLVVLSLGLSLFGSIRRRRAGGLSNA